MTTTSNLYEWKKLEKDNIVTIGLTDFAKSELGEIVFIELPKEGLQIQAEELLAVIESTKAATDIYSSVTGRVVAVNQRLIKEPHLLNESPESERWICKIQLQ